MLSIHPRLKISWLIAGTLCVWVGMFSQSAYATTLAPLSIEQMTDASTYVIRGTAHESWTEVDERYRVWTRTRVTVKECYKGNDVPNEIIIDRLGGTHGTLDLDVPGHVVFSEGENLLAFVYKTEDDKHVIVSKFLGKYTIRRAPGEKRRHLAHWHPRKNEAFDHRFIPHPSPERRVYFDDVLTKIQNRVDVGWDGKPIPGISPEKLEKINRLERRMPR